MFYTSYRCVVCKKEFVLLTHDIKSMRKGRYISCPYCNSKRIYKTKSTDDLRECMEENAYKRVKGGALKQVRYK